MKPNYCSGGFGSGRFSSLQNTSYRSQNDSFNQSQDSSASNTDYFSTSPFIVYRSAKYVQPHARALQNFKNYAKYYVVDPAVVLANRCKDAVLQICGLLLLLLTCPLWILMILGLFLVRRLRSSLVRKVYPDLIHLDDNSFTQFNPDSNGIVNSIIWTKGKLDASTITNRFKFLFKENPNLYSLLKLKLSSRYGAKVWENCSDSFSLSNHIVEAPKRFCNCPVVDEPLKELYRTGSNNKSILQKYVSFCVSTPLDSDSPPWKIHVISYISREDGLREKTCLVIRMHVALIKNGEVRGALRELFLNYSSPEDKEKEKCLVVRAEDGRSEEKIKGRLEIWRAKYNRFQSKIRKTFKSHQIAFTIWLSLKLKQLEFHSKTVVFSIIMLDLRDSLTLFLSKIGFAMQDAFTSVLYYLGRLLINVQAFAAIPVIVLVSLLRQNRLEKLGLRGNLLVPGKRLISWSDLLHADLVEEIGRKVGQLSPESVMMLACANALSDYYYQNNMTIPTKIGFTINNTCNPMSTSRALKAVYIPGNERGPLTSNQKLKIVEERTEKYPEWKTLSLKYIFQYLSLILPTFLAHKVQKSIVSSYPFSFTDVNLKADSVFECGQDFLPLRQLFGELVEDFTFWPLPPLSDYGVSITLVQYTGKMRLFVMSPFQSMDTILTHRCNQYLIKLAEDVGVDRSLIPYSRRTSPNSTSCSTPQPSLPFVNPIDNLSLNGKKTPSPSIINANV